MDDKENLNQNENNENEVKENLEPTNENVVDEKEESVASNDTNESTPEVKEEPIQTEVTEENKTEENVEQNINPSYKVNENDEIVLDNTSDVNPPVAPLENKKAKLKEPMDKKKKILIITTAIVAFVVLFSAIFFPTFFYYRHKIMVKDAASFTSEKALNKATNSNYYFVLQKDVETENLTLEKCSASIDLHSHTLTVTGTLTLKTTDGATVNIGTRKSGEYVNKGQLIVENLVIEGDNATYNFASNVKVNGSITIKAKNVTLNGLQVDDSAKIEVSNECKINGNITTSETALMEFDNCNSVIVNANITAKNTVFNNSNITINNNATLNDVDLTSSTAQIYGSVNSITNGDQVAMLQGHTCNSYKDIKVLGIYNAFEDNLTITNCSKVIYIEKLQAPSDLIIKEEGDSFFAVAAKVDNASSYVFIVNGIEKATQPSELYDVTTVLNGGANNTIAVKVKGNYSFDMLTQEAPSTLYMDSDDTTTIEYSYTLQLSTPDVTLANSSVGDGSILKIAKVSYADYYKVVIDGNTTIEIKDDNKTAVESSDGLNLKNYSEEIANIFNTVGYHSVRVTACSNQKYLTSSRESMASNKVTATLNNVSEASYTYTDVDDSYELTITIPQVENAKIYVIKIGDVEIKTTSLETKYSIKKESVTDVKNLAITIKAEGYGFYNDSTETTVTYKEVV